MQRTRRCSSTCRSAIGRPVKALSAALRFPQHSPKRRLKAKRGSSPLAVRGPTAWAALFTLRMGSFHRRGLSCRKVRNQASRLGNKGRTRRRRGNGRRNVTSCPRTFRRHLLPGQNAFRRHRAQPGIQVHAPEAVIPLVYFRESAIHDWATGHSGSEALPTTNVLGDCNLALEGELVVPIPPLLQLELDPHITDQQDPQMPCKRYVTPPLVSFALTRATAMLG